MNYTAEPQRSACVMEGVQPLLSELQETVNVQFRDCDDAERHGWEQFIHGIFRKAYGAELQSFYPNLIGFSDAERIHGVVGYRDGMVKPLFSEQYLDGPVEKVMTTHLQHKVERRHLVEVGNLSLAGTGEARWVIAATTMFLHAAGYRWVLFTAVTSLFNAFQRLGLQPITIATPDPNRLPDQGRSWGSYYQAGPMVCAGDIEAGYRKLSAHISQRQPRLHTLFQETCRLGNKVRFDHAQDAREAV